MARHSQPAYLLMNVKYLCWLLVLGGCDLSTDHQDDRPATLQFITQAVLKPSCGTATCHSAMKAQSNDVFDSVEGTRASIALHPELVITCDRVIPPSTDNCAHDDDLQQSYLLTVITQGDAEGERMPLDQPMSNKDIFLISTWIKDGAPGLEP
ncbi:MAG: hypothetical protein ABI678_01450 [Kofleriaceae bacterium]